MSLAIKLLVMGGTLLLLVTSPSCNSKSVVREKPAAKAKTALSLKCRAEAAPEWTALLERQSGWFAADGIFSIALDGADPNTGDEETLLIFSDTFVGEVKDGKPQAGYSMVHNSVAYMQGVDADATKISFHYNQDGSGKPTSLFGKDRPRMEREIFHWLGDGFVNRDLNDTLYIFAYHVMWTGDNVFDFVEPGVSLLAIPAGSRPPFSGHRTIDTPLHVKSPWLGEGNLGAAILVNTEWAGTPHPDNYVYVYGCLGEKKSLVVARVRPDRFESFGSWRYWNGHDWDAKIGELTGITDSVSNELSVTPLSDGRVLAVFQVKGLSEKVGIRVGASPNGPFGEIQEIFTTPEMATGVWTYNAKAHPALSKPGELLVSYNTITPDLWNDIEKDVSIYRPRFIRLIIDE